MATYTSLPKLLILVALVNSTLLTLLAKLVSYTFRCEIPKLSSVTNFDYPDQSPSLSIDIVIPRPQ